jgi:antitoxin (DNA-binding transcriptional repressor) of toxin-antitoxin stability system
MRKDVTVDELREKLDELLAEVDNGTTVTIMRGNRAVATISRGNLVDIQPPRETGRFQDVPVGARPKTLTSDSVEMLVEERELERSGKKFGS